MILNAYKHDVQESQLQRLPLRRRRRQQQQQKNGSYNNNIVIWMTIIMTIVSFGSKNCMGWSPSVPTLHTSIRLLHRHSTTFVGMVPRNSNNNKNKKNNQNAKKDDYLDVDFERVISEDASATDNGDDKDDNFVDDNSESLFEKSLLDLSLDSGDPMWKETRVPFTRSSTGEYIDVKLAFMIDVPSPEDGSDDAVRQYGIGVPFDEAVAIVIETDKSGKSFKHKDSLGTVTHVDPDEYETNEEGLELMEIFAKLVKQQLGEEFVLRKTPKVLTISGGDLSKYTKDFQKNLMPKPFSTQELLDATLNNDQSDDELMTEFFDFMKRELGQEEFDKTMKAEMTEGEKKMLKYFEIPGIGALEDDDTEGFDELLNSIQKELETGVIEGADEFKMKNVEGMSLRLLGMSYADGSKSYSLVKLLQPYLLVGRYIPPGSTRRSSRSSSDDDDDDEEEEEVSEGPQFELLTKEEEALIIPKLEQLCSDDLEKAGLSFGNYNTKKTP